MTDSLLIFIQRQNEMHSYRTGLSAWLSFLFTSLVVSAVWHCSVGQWEHRVTEQFMRRKMIEYALLAYKKLRVKL